MKNFFKIYPKIPYVKTLKISCMMAKYFSTVFQINNDKLRDNQQDVCQSKVGNKNEGWFVWTKNSNN